MDLGLAGRVVVITGGSAGIGRATAQLFAEEGCRVAICGRSAARLEEAARAVAAATGADVLPVAADIRRPGDTARLLAAARERFGGVDVLVNNAGAPAPKPYEEMAHQDWQEVLSYKLVGYVTCATQVLPYMRERGGGRIVNVVGSAGREPNPWTTSTGIVNAALLNFTKTLASQVARDNILVNAVSPGPIDTGRWSGLAARDPAATAAVIAEIPVGRIGRPEDVAGAIVFLASRQASFITGASLTIDGGRCRSVAF
ncbi:MAG: glucose 1-dehydrogenase [Chloroflexi bacterium]|nr:glucose 1-dehydrogenase [Chloroflexota bacterium]